MFFATSSHFRVAIYREKHSSELYIYSLQIYILAGSNILEAVYHLKL